MAAALFTGLVCSELLCRSAAFRDLAGRLAGRGHLVTIANGKGIYESDLGSGEEAIASDLVIAENLGHAAAKEVIDPARVDRELSLLQAQFAGEKPFTASLRASGLSVPLLRERIADQLRTLQWLEKQVTPGTVVTEQECRQFYEAHPEHFMLPLRFRASHLFLAAPAETPPGVIDEKEIAIAALPARLTQGESLSQLAAETSEDENTKARGGDLGFFSESRMTPEFIAEIRKLRAGEISEAFRSHLGFHIAQLRETKAARLLSFEEARAEIFLALSNERRAVNVHQIAENLRQPN